MSECTALVISVVECAAYVFRVVRMAFTICVGWQGPWLLAARVPEPHIATHAGAHCHTTLHATLPHHTSTSRCTLSHHAEYPTTLPHPHCLHVSHSWMGRGSLMWQCDEAVWCGGVGGNQCGVTRQCGAAVCTAVLTSSTSAVTAPLGDSGGCRDRRI